MKVGFAYLSAQKINNGIHHLIGRRRTPQKDKQQLYQEPDATNDTELQQPENILVKHEV